jgi:N-acetylmuramoyl-L-alanine amidase CwlA
VKIISARWHGQARSRTDLIVIHSTENNLRTGIAETVAQYFAGGSVKASAHYVVDSDEVIQCVDPALIAWAAPGSNEIGIQIEMCGKAEWTQAQWLLPAAQAMIKHAKWLVHDLAAKYDIPLALINADGLKAGARGVTRHRDVTKAWHRSTHTDPGQGFDMDWLL